MKLIADKAIPPSLSVRDMKYGDFAVVSSGEFSGEVVFKNIAGVHGLTTHRYWPSQYIAEHSNGHTYEYLPEFSVILLQPNDTLTVAK